MTTRREMLGLTTIGTASILGLRTSHAEEKKEPEKATFSGPGITITSPISGTTIGTTVTVWGSYTASFRTKEGKEVTVTNAPTITCKLYDSRDAEKFDATSSVQIDTTRFTWMADIVVPVASPAIEMKIKATISFGSTPGTPSEILDLTYNSAPGVAIGDPGQVMAGTLPTNPMPTGSVVDRRITSLSTMYIHKGTIIGGRKFATIDSTNDSWDSRHFLVGSTTNRRKASLVAYGFGIDPLSGKPIMVSVSKKDLMAPG